MIRARRAHARVLSYFLSGFAASRRTTMCETSHGTDASRCGYAHWRMYERTHARRCADAHERTHEHARALRVRTSAHERAHSSRIGRSSVQQQTHALRMRARTRACDHARDHDHPHAADAHARARIRKHTPTNVRARSHNMRAISARTYSESYERMHSPWEQRAQSESTHKLSMHVNCALFHTRAYAFAQHSLSRCVRVPATNTFKP